MIARSQKEYLLQQRVKKEIGLMEPQTLEQIKSWPQMTEEEAKLLFIRQSAQEAYAKGEIKEATKDVLKSIVEISTVNSMTKEEIGLHIGNLEKARSFLAAFTQGLQQAFAKEEEPKFKAKREKEKQDKVLAKLTSSKDKKVNELIEMARKLATDPSLEKKETKPPVSKVTCPKCNKETFSLKFHKC